MAAERFLLLPLDGERSFLFFLVPVELFFRALLLPLSLLFCLYFFDLFLDEVVDEGLLALEDLTLLLSFLVAEGLLFAALASSLSL